SRRRHTWFSRDWSSDVCSSDLLSMTGLTGATFIQLTGGSPDAPRLLPEGDEVSVILTEASALQNIADTANRLVARLDEVLSDEKDRKSVVWGKEGGGGRTEKLE